MTKTKVLIVISVGLFLLTFVFNNTVYSWDSFINKIKSDNKKISTNALSSAITHNKKGLTFLESGYPLHAVNEFKIALMLNPNTTMSASIYNNLGQAYEMLRAYDLAIASYQHAIKINPDFAIYYKNLVYVYKAKRSLDKAQKEYETIISINKDDAQAYFVLGLISLETSQNEKAKEYFSKFIQLEPNVDLANAAKKYLANL